ncbi:protein Dr1-like [Corticium candelabrum]|uniref:protein Dr1-like n=1 Tax=Corticium candelabrum TaxID=121492 RepID=UPI002E2FFFAB|nr:protein Dr1-like [Corticium candelabrum]
MMADQDPQADDDVNLPRAAVNKLIKEMLPNIRVANDARELILNCCTEFIHLLASEANELCGKQSKKTITPEHIIKALESLGFASYVVEVSDVLTEHKKEAKTRRKASTKLEKMGIPEEELLRQQQALFAQARIEQAQAEQEEFMKWKQAQTIQQQESSTIAPVSEHDNHNDEHDDDN